MALTQSRKQRLAKQRRERAAAKELQRSRVQVAEAAQYRAGYVEAERVLQGRIQGLCEKISLLEGRLYLLKRSHLTLVHDMCALEPHNQQVVQVQNGEYRPS